MNVSKKCNKVVISDTGHTECSNLTEAKWAKYTCYHENKYM